MRGALLRLVVVTMAVRTGAQVRAPFPQGASMSTLGTVVWSDDLTGRQPWTAAALLADTLRFGVALSGVDYYDDMDNLAERDIRHAMAGGWYHNRFFTVKGSYEHFSALDVYYEQIGRFSLGSSALRWLAASVEVRGARVGVRGSGRDSETLLELGATVWVPRRYVAIAAAVEHLAVERAGAEGFETDPCVRVGVHTRRHRWGALGCTGEVVFAEEPYVRLALGEQLRIHPNVGIDAGVSTEPFMVAFGLTVVWRSCATQAAFVHHPDLGWSKGFVVDWAHR